MSLSTRIEQILIRNDGGGTWSYTLKPTNFDVDLQDVNWGAPSDEALDASLRQNFRGFRGVIDIRWEKITDTTVNGATFGDLLNDIVTSLATNKDDGVEISLDGGTNYDTYVPDGTSYGTSYTNQIGRGNGSLSFRSQQLITSIPTYLEAPSV